MTWIPDSGLPYWSKMNLYFTSEIGNCLDLFSTPMALKPQAKYAMKAFSSNWKHERLSVFVGVPQTMQNLVISRSCLERTAKECGKIYNTRAQPLFCSLKLFFRDVLVAVVVVVS